MRGKVMILPIEVLVWCFGLSHFTTHTAAFPVGGARAHLQFIWGFVWLAAARQLLKSCTEAGKTLWAAHADHAESGLERLNFKNQFWFVFFIILGCFFFNGRCECVETFMMNVRFDITTSGWWCTSTQRLEKVQPHNNLFNLSNTIKDDSLIIFLLLL